MFELTNKVAVITGGGSGIGQAIALLFAKHGAQTVVLDVDGDAASATVNSISRTGGRAKEDFDRIYNVNVKGVFLCSQAAIEAMLRQNEGVILNMASIVSCIGIADRFAYTMSKGAVLTMTRSIAVDYMSNNIRCNCICPARVHTAFVDGYVAKNYPGREQEVLQELAHYQPMGRMGTPEEVAALALYLCSDEASFITGQAYPIDGGVLVT
jgi:2-keto-3-deoxy-L-fuconate dehydrogenase